MLVQIVSELNFGEKCSIKLTKDMFAVEKTHNNLYNVESTFREFGEANSPPIAKSLFGVLFAEAGKKKKKEKSEVIVISVNNPQPKGHGGMYPIFIPSCGGHGGYGGYGRRKRSISWSTLESSNFNKLQH